MERVNVLSDLLCLDIVLVLHRYKFYMSNLCKNSSEVCSSSNDAMSMCICSFFCCAGETLSNVFIALHGTLMYIANAILVIILKFID